MFYSPEADALRAFFRDKLRMEHLDAGEGWLIFTPPEGEIGFHPASENRHDISLYCDDITGTIAELRERGVEFEGEIEDHGYGLVTHIKAPGGLKIQLYQPRYR
jgi:hypothetical protein